MDSSLSGEKLEAKEMKAERQQDIINNVSKVHGVLPMALNILAV